MVDDRYDLNRFVTAQQPIYNQAVEELRAGRKRSHWMWFVFPQLGGLGASSMAQFYGIGSVDEARAYLAHGVLGPRLVQCTEILLALDEPSLRKIFGTPDDFKFRSCMTLFEAAAGAADRLFGPALAHFCTGQRDQRTLDLLALG